MKCYDWDQLLDTEDMLALTEEALTPKPARPLSWRRLGALAACLALILCLTNYQALATGVQTLIRYFSGVGAAETGADLRIQEGELEFELSGRTYLISGAYARDGFLFVPLEVVSRSEERLNKNDYQNLYVKLEISQDGQNLAGSNPFLDLSDNGSYAAGQYTALTRKRIPFSPLQEEQYLGWRYLPEGYQSYAQAVFTYEAANPAERYTLRVEDYLTDQVMEVELTLAPPEEISAICEQRTVGEIQVTALVSADGRRLSLYGAMANADEWWKSLVELQADPIYGVQFLEADGTYHQGLPRRPGGTDGAGYAQEILLTQDTGPITAVRIGRIYYAYDDMDDGLVSRWVDLDWVISLTETK